MIDHFISRVPPQSAYRSPAWKSLSRRKPGAGLKGFSSGGCSWNKKRRDKESQLEAPLEAGRNKDSGCDIVEHFWMYLKLLDSPSISSIPIFNEEHCRAIQKKKNQSEWTIRKVLKNQTPLKEATCICDSNFWLSQCWTQGGRELSLASVCDVSD